VAKHNKVEVVDVEGIKVDQYNESITILNDHNHGLNSLPPKESKYPNNLYS